MEFGPRVIGVVLSGRLDDGAAGLLAIRRCGGIGIVQDPQEDGVAKDMLESALRAAPEHCLPAAEIAPLLARLVTGPAAAARPAPADLELEARAARRAMTDPKELSRMGCSVGITCPECDGPLWELGETPSETFRCHVGHAFSIQALFEGQARALERALWVAFRTLTERSRLIERMFTDSLERGQNSSAAGYQARLQELQQHSDAVRLALSALDLPKEEPA